MLRETSFLVGGILVIGLGIALAAGLLWAGAGWLYAGAWTGAVVAVGLGAFFVHVGTEERRERRRLVAADATGSEPRP